MALHNGDKLRHYDTKVEDNSKNVENEYDTVKKTGNSVKIGNLHLFMN
jgi:hypothetical protein